MRVAICSMFNNSIIRGDLGCYRRQIEALDWPKSQLRLYLAEGDSKDVTWWALKEWRRQDNRVHPIKIDMGVPVKGSVTDPDRLIHGCVVGSAARNLALADGWAERILWLESDLIIGPELLQRLTDNDFDYVAPWICIEDQGTGETNIEKLRDLAAWQVAFYDTWAFRDRPGHCFDWGAYRPEAPIQMYSVGSCLMGKTDVVAKSNYPSDHAIVGWCEQARKAGHEVWCDPRVDVWHKAPKQC